MWPRLALHPPTLSPAGSLAPQVRRWFELRSGCVLYFYANQRGGALLGNIIFAEGECGGCVGAVAIEPLSLSLSLSLCLSLPPPPPPHI
jgi:hypothetical protein